MIYCKGVAAILCATLFVAVTSSMWKWTEFRGVYDDICYLRQAHLFQRFGLDGLRTDISRDDDGSFAAMEKAIGWQGWSDPSQAVCHTHLKNSKIVIQYPPGTGAALAIFPEGVQAKILYISVATLLLAAAWAMISMAETPVLVVLSGITGGAAIYFMINPAKSSYSMAPTMLFCAVVGYLTSLGTESKRNSLLLGLALGALVNFRIANLLLAVGYFATLLILILTKPSGKRLVNGSIFSLAFLIGLAPTLAANWVNTGSPLKTTYSAIDATPPVLSLEPLRYYLTDLQGILIAIAIVAALWAILKGASRLRLTGTIVAANIVANLTFFFTHPLFTQYYLMPCAMLSIWALAFAVLKDRPTSAREICYLQKEAAGRHSGPKQSHP